MEEGWLFQEHPSSRPLAKTKISKITSALRKSGTLELMGLVQFQKEDKPKKNLKKS
jgi:hypothetical protein